MAPPALRSEAVVQQVGQSRGRAQQRGAASPPCALLGAAIAALLLATLSWLLRGSGAPEAPRIRLSGPGVETVPITSAAAPGEVRIAVAALLSPRRSLAAHGALFDVLRARLGRPVRIVQRRTYAEVNELLLAGDALIGFVCSGAFGAAGEATLEPLVLPVVGGLRTYQSYIIVRYGFPRTGFDGLGGHSFALTDPLSNSGCLYPRALLAERGTSPEAFFERVVWTGSHEGSIEAVAHGLVDGAAVDSLVYEYVRERDPALFARTRVVAVSPPFGAPPVVASPAAPPELRAQVRAVLLGLHETPDGRAALADLRIDRFDDAHPQDYASVRAMQVAVARFRRGGR